MRRPWRRLVLVRISEVQSVLVPCVSWIASSQGILIAPRSSTLERLAFAGAEQRVLQCVCYVAVFVLLRQVVITLATAQAQSAIVVAAAERPPDVHTGRAGYEPRAGVDQARNRPADVFEPQRMRA